MAIMMIYVELIIKFKATLQAEVEALKKKMAIVHSRFAQPQSEKKINKS